jgi:hypothetical protein
VQDTLNIDLGTAEVRGAVEIDAKPQDMDTTVTASSPGVPVALFLVERQDEDAVMTDLLKNEETSPKILAKTDQGESVTLKHTLPANKDYTVLIRGGPKPTKVKITVSGSY